jgi:hypothetical protein
MSENLLGRKTSLDLEECFIARGSYIPNQTNAHLVLVLNFFLIPLTIDQKEASSFLRIRSQPINTPI